MPHDDGDASHLPQLPDESYADYLQRSGISVVPDESVRAREQERGAPVLGCVLIYEVDEDGFVYALAHHPDLPPDALDAFCREGMSRCAHFAEHGPDGEFLWEKRSDAGYQAWIVAHQLPSL
ncbi:hypothetical protein [Allobranchiibius huperziae]|uniref:Uncharacterized protein n=1 Tax=Allobranchiibius huperziae TaxID=1874116 RepID=A0A853DE04_9MICO|nr:hypothetical protein [Allobranchiibius huperziae]NYJ75806.1 hypothetical protein [Allobranchiibius huperziae]